MLIGRKNEISTLNSTLHDENSHFIAIYGRRRIGKTFLVREVFNYRFTFQHSGLAEGNLQMQLFAFRASLKDAGLTTKKQPKNWMEAFEDLKELIRQSTECKKVIFLDELSWMDTPRSDFMVALENFWNGWASGRRDIVLIVCASATSWILSKIIHNKGGLYHRLTNHINLLPFTLKECEEFVKQKQININRAQILQYYMVFGGIPFYWGLLKKGFSVSQSIDNLLFSENADLKDEFRYLFASIYKNPTVHLQIIQALAQKKIGMTREEIINTSGLINSGDLTKKLEELEACGFIRKYYAFGMKKKNAIYQLMDFFTLFYYQFLHKQSNDQHFWSNQINTPTVNTWEGLAFERVCLSHLKQIKQKLGISGILTEANSWYCKPEPDRGIAGSQIDLLIVRKDQVINLCEMKYSNSEYAVTEKTTQSINRKISDFCKLTSTKYAIFPTLLTTYGIVDNSYSGYFQSVITLNDLFE